MFTFIPKALDLGDMNPEEQNVSQAVTSGLVVGLRALALYVQGTATENMAGGKHMADAEIFAPAPQYMRPGSAVEARHGEVARG